VTELGKQSGDHYPTELDRNRVAELTLGIGPRAHGGEVVWEGHDPQHLRDSEAPSPPITALVVHILPMERTNPWSRLRLKCRRWTVRVKPQQERPVTASPLKDIATAVSIRMPQIVLSGRNLSSQISELAFHNLFLFCYTRQKISENIATGDVRDLSSVDYTSVLTPAGMCHTRKLECFAVTAAHDENSAPKLRDSVVGSQ
jgi:hypothetical protein